VSAKRVGLGVVAAGVAVLALFLLGVFRGGTEYVSGMRAGNLDGGNESGAQVRLRRGGSEMIGLGFVKNVGKSPVLIESIQPLSTSPELHVTRGRIWRIKPTAHMSLPMWWRGWPPKDVPISPPKTKPAWRDPHPDYLSLPTRGTIPPGAEAQLVYGIVLHADPSPKIRITALRITFVQSGRTVIWTVPEEVRVDYHR
jgi:hypothetical protein